MLISWHWAITTFHQDVFLTIIYISRLFESLYKWTWPFVYCPCVNNVTSILCNNLKASFCDYWNSGLSIFLIFRFPDLSTIIYCYILWRKKKISHSVHAYNKSRELKASSTIQSMWLGTTQPCFLSWYSRNKAKLWKYVELCKFVQSFIQLVHYSQDHFHKVILKMPLLLD